tara:strand:- start:12845 stop:13801 length:957 start_codon:yes stop_codon:yes gene_type:complete
MNIVIVWTGKSKSGGEYYMSNIYSSFIEAGYRISKYKVKNFNLKKIYILICKSVGSGNNFFIYETRSPKIVFISLILKFFGYVTIGIHQEKHWINAKNIYRNIFLRLCFFLSKQFSNHIITNSILMKSTFTKKNSIIINPGCDRFQKTNIDYENKKINHLYYFGDISKRKGIKYIKELIKNKLFINSKLKLFVTNKKVFELLDSSKCELNENVNIGNIPKNSIVLVPSFFEGYGMVIAEAIYRGDILVAASDRITDELRNKCHMQIFSDSLKVEDRIIKIKNAFNSNFNSQNRSYNLTKWSEMKDKFINFFIEISQLS